MFFIAMIGPGPGMIVARIPATKASGAPRSTSRSISSELRDFFAGFGFGGLRFFFVSIPLSTNAARSASAPIVRSTQASAGGREPETKLLPWKANTIAEPTLIVVSSPPARKPARIGTGRGVFSASTTTMSRSGKNIARQARR